ncbi:MAG: archaeosortase A, partial [Thermoplasmata archaeon]
VFFSIGDVFNAAVCMLALPFYAFLGYHEYISFLRDEDNKSLKWVTGASFFAGGLYFLIDKIPVLSGYLIYIVAVQSVWLTNAFGYSYGVGDINYAGNPLWYRTNFNDIFVPIEGSRLSIIQSCTAIQSMLIFVGAIYCVQALSRRKWMAFFATVPVIYILNLIRNVGMIYMMDVLGWSYDLSHNTIGKGGSFLALIILAVISFKLLPELLDNIWGIIDLKDRFKKKEGVEEDEKNEDLEKEPFEDDLVKEDDDKEGLVGEHEAVDDDEEMLEGEQKKENEDKEGLDEEHEKVNEDKEVKEGEHLKEGVEKDELEGKEG